MSRKIHALLSKDAQNEIALFQQSFVEELQCMINNFDIVVIGVQLSSRNRQVSSLLQATNHTVKELYLRPWMMDKHKKLAVMLWSGWPTFPQIFIRGMLIGGEQELRRTIQNGELNHRLASK